MLQASIALSAFSALLLGGWRGAATKLAIQRPMGLRTGLSKLEELRNEAIQTVYAHKISFQRGFFYPGNGVRMRVRFPYGVYNAETGTVSDVSLSSYMICNNTPRMNVDLPVNAAPVQKYLEAAMMDKSCKTVYDIEEKYINCLFIAEFEWKKDEIDNVSFGHIDKCRESIEKAGVPAGLRSVIPYFVTVVKVAHQLLSNHTEMENDDWPYERQGWSLAHLYYGPLNRGGRVGADGAIGFMGQDLYTRWGSLNLYGPGISSRPLPESLAPVLKEKQGDGGFYAIGRCGAQIIPTEFTATKCPYHREGGWKSIRDIVFLRAQDDIRGGRM